MDEVRERRQRTRLVVDLAALKADFESKQYSQKDLGKRHGIVDYRTLRSYLVKAGLDMTVLEGVILPQRRRAHKAGPISLDLDALVLRAVRSVVVTKHITDAVQGIAALLEEPKVSAKDVTEAVQRLHF